MPRVLVTPTMLRNQPGPFADILQQGGFEVVFPPEDVNTLEPAVIEQLLADDIDAMLASTEPLSEAILHGSTLRAIARMGVGYDSIDIPAATAADIAVTITPGVLEESVAEHTIAMLLGLTRGIVQRDREVRAGKWSRAAMPRLAGKTLGIAGLGRIGKAVAPRAIGLGMNVIAADPCLDEAFAEQTGVKYVSFDELLTSSDVVSIHAAYMAETTHLFNAATLARMKPGAILVNTSRGGLVDEAALYDALKSGHLSGAALDVFEQEPPPVDHPLLSLPNVLTCTHMGGLDLQSEIDASSLAAHCIVDLHNGLRPDSCLVNSKLRADWKW